MEKSNTSEHHLDNDSTTLIPLSEQLVPVDVFVTAEFPVTSKKMISNAKSNLCAGNFLNTKLSKTLVQDLTSKEKGFFPYWNPSVAEMSGKLWLPTGTGYQDSGVSLFDGSLKGTAGSSWFSTTCSNRQNKNSPVISCRSSTCSPVVFMDSGTTVIRSKKIRIYPDKNQRVLFRKWFGASRYIFNKTIEYLKKPGTKANWMKIKGWLLKELPDWAKEIPYQIKAIAIRDACIAVKNAKKKFKETGKPQRVSYKSRKDPNQSVFIPKSAIRNGSIYITSTGDLFSSEEIDDADFDCRLVFQSGRYFLVMPEERKILVPENQRDGIVALDPGVRAFLTYYSEISAGKIGSEDFGRICRLCYYLDELQSKISKAKSRKKKRLKKAAAKLRWRIKDLISEIHHKAATWLCKTFDTIVIPPFETSQMVSKLRSKTARAMLTWAHFRFRQILDNTAEIYSAKIVEQCEAYTSKTCSACGNIQNIGSKKVLKCSCGVQLDRDINGARGIFLRALGDLPSLKCELQSAIVSFG